MWPSKAPRRTSKTYSKPSESSRVCVSPRNSTANIGTPRYYKVFRGFAFAEFTSIEEARNAFTALGNTHLYGRKLAIEWAEEEE